MNFLRTTSTRRLLAGSALSLALVIGGVAAAMASSGGGTPPPAKPLAAAIHDSLTGAQAHRRHRARPLHEQPHLERRAAARLAAPDGSERSPLVRRRQAAARAAVRRGRRADHARRRRALGLRRLEQHALQGSSRHPHRPERGCRRRRGSWRAERRSRSPPRWRSSAQQATLSGADPTTQRRSARLPADASRRSTTRACSARPQIAWDAAHGIPLHVSLAAAGSSSPVLALDVTDISYGSVDAARLRDRAARRREGRRSRATRAIPDPRAPRSRPRWRASRRFRPRVPFTLAAPATLVGLPRTGVRLISDGTQPAALVTYGQSLGAIAVIERSLPRPPRPRAALSAACRRSRSTARPGTSCRRRSARSSPSSAPA